MAKISQYPDGGAIQAADQLVIARAGANYSILGSGVGGGTKIEGALNNGKISITVVSNNITVALKTWAGADPSASDPVKVYINGNERSITSALSVTLNAGTQWFGLGTPFAALEQNFFAYLSWRAASSAVVIGFSRIPYARVYSDFSATTTNEKHGAFSTAPASTDDVVVIGRFAATLSAAAAYNWSVPTFASSNLIQYPIYETEWLNWLPTLVGFSANPTSSVYQYKIKLENVTIIIRQGASGTSNATTLTATLPFTAKTLTNQGWSSSFRGEDNGVSGATPCLGTFVSGVGVIQFFKDYAATAWTALGNKRILSGYIDYQIV